MSFRRAAGPEAGRDLTDRLDRPGDAGGIHVEVGDHADPRRVERVGGHARRGHSLGERIGGREIRIDVEEHDVRSNAPDRILALESVHGVDALGQHPGVFVVDREPFVMMIQGVDRRRGEHAGLSHAAPEHLSETTRSCDQIRGAHESAPDGGAESLGEADVDGVGRSGELVERVASGDAGVEEPRAVDVDVEFAFPTDGGDGFEAVEGPHRTAAPVVISI